MILNLFEKTKFAKVFLLIFTTSYFIFQLIYINADTPVFLSDNPGAYCDEGYKTLDARNLVLFGKTHWTEKDEYRGWIKRSPITVYFNFLLFKLFGISFAVARLGNLVFAIGSLFLFFLILNKSYDLQCALLSFGLCAINHVFFFYSRIALFEFKMMFFILLGLYFMLFIKQNYLYLVPAIVCWIVAYYCKATALIFYLSLIFYFFATYKNGWLLNSLLRTRNLIISALLFLSIFLVLEYLFINHRDYYDSVSLFGRYFRSPMGAVLFWISQAFFTKNPFLSFFAIIFVGYMIILIVEGKLYNQKDLFFVIWLILGISVLSFVSYQPLRYYVYVVFPLIAVAVRGILSFSSIWNILFEKNKLWLKGTIFVLSFYLFVIHTVFLPFMPARTVDWHIQAIKLLVVFSVITVLILALVYILLKNKKAVREGIFGIEYRIFSRVLLMLIICVHIIPIAKWALHANYELVYMSKKISELSDDPILVGDWAPQLCINTDRKVLYLAMDEKTKWSMNFNNLDKIKPNYLVIVDGLNDAILRLFKLKYPAVAKDTPQYIYPYAARSLHFYELNFKN